MGDKKLVGHAYNVDFLNVVFAVSSIFLFICTVWMVWDDYDREWKNYQRRFVQLEMEVTRASLAQAEADVDQEKLQALENELSAEEEKLAASQNQVTELEDKLSAVNNDLYRANQDYQFAKATYDVDRYAYEVRTNEDDSIGEQESAVIAEALEHVNQLNLAIEKVTADRDVLQDEIGALTGRGDDIRSQIRSLNGEKIRLEDRIAVLQPRLINDLVLNAPLLDFLAPTIRVQQVITPTVVDDLNFTRVVKMDRCMTCHLSIDREGYEDYPQPFKTHPNLDVYIGSASPHPMKEIGCTVCHEGMGQSITFRDASHTPFDSHWLHDREETERWEGEHEWKEPHLWDYPMLPSQMTEASCAKCHDAQVYVPKADKLNLAYGLYERAGCYACHKSEGFDGLRKPGPSLTKIDSKLTREWVANWVREPSSIKPSTWMPRVWYNENSSSSEDGPRNEAEIHATVSYLFANSEPHEFKVPSPPAGDVTRGEALVANIGCLACHVVDETSRFEAGPRRTFGQPLQNIGSKTTYEWFYNWVRDPEHYSADTYMPNMRLTGREAADIATYLSSMTGSSGEVAKASYEEQDIDNVLLDYLKTVMPTEEALETVDGMDLETKTLELGRRAITRYGCYSCHEINGFENVQPIGIELSEEGSKLLSQLDFQFVHIPHTKTAWFSQKILEPRSFDRNRVLVPMDRLRMPNYGFSEEETELFVTAIMSFQRKVQRPEAMPPGSARLDALVAGQNLTRRRNCVACHEIDGDGGDYRTLLDDPSLAPPLLTPQGAKVKPEWMYSFFHNVIPIRPWLDVRMPSFSLDDAHWNEAIRYFQAVSNVVGPFKMKEVFRAADARGGAELFKLLQCQRCHVLDKIPEGQPTANLAPDLRMTPERLQPDWILDWLILPLAIQPGTRMPGYWPDFPETYYEHLDGDAKAQILAIRNYLMTFRGGPSPVEGTRIGIYVPPVTSSDD